MKGCFLERIKHLIVKRKKGRTMQIKRNCVTRASKQKSKELGLNIEEMGQLLNKCNWTKLIGEEEEHPEKPIRSSVIPATIMSSHKENPKKHKVSQLNSTKLLRKLWGHRDLDSKTRTGSKKKKKKENYHISKIITHFVLLKFRCSGLIQHIHFITWTEI